MSAAGVLPDHDAIRGSRPLYLVQRDAQPRPTSRNQEAEPPLQTWDILNQQVGTLFILAGLEERGRFNRSRVTVRIPPLCAMPSWSGTTAVGWFLDGSDDVRNRRGRKIMV